MNANEYYRAGQLTEATAAATREVKADPGNVSKRCFLADLFCFAGDLERADRQLDAAAQVNPSTAVAVTLRRQLLRAEQARRQCFTEGRLPEFLDQPSDELRLRLQAAIALRDRDIRTATKLLAEAESLRVVVPGVCNDRPFDQFSDLDELTASFFEVCTATGKYYWIPVELVERLEFVAPSTTQDLLWRSARINVRVSTDATGGVVYFPTLYYGSHTHADEAVKLGLMTDWLEGGDAPYRGVGQRIFDVGGMEIPILEVRRIEFRHKAQPQV